MLSAEETLNEIEHNVFVNTDDVEIKMSKDCYRTLKNTLKKQVAKKPLNIEDKYWGCPHCYGLLMVRWITYPVNPVPLECGREYCEDCGQKIDWSE